MATKKVLKKAFPIRMVRKPIRHSTKGDAEQACGRVSIAIRCGSGSYIRAGGWWGADHSPLREGH
jgi:hypothetical protein